jgi:hypothetical protein
VKHVLLASKKVGLLFEIKPNQPMPLQGLTIWAQRIVAGIDSSVGEKLAIAMLADRALNVVANVQRPEDLQSHAAYPLEILAGYEADEK